MTLYQCVVNLIFVVFFFLCLSFVEAQYEDTRCICECQAVQPINQTKPKRVFIKTFSDHDQCICEDVIDPNVLEIFTKFCDGCKCEWQRRNTTTIKVVVIMIICVTGLLFLYMLFLLCLDPLMSRRPKTYEEQRNEEDTQSIHRTSEELSSVRPRPKAIMSRVKHEVSRVRGEQQKWKGQVQEQRKHIYDRHTMLN